MIELALSEPGMRALLAAIAAVGEGPDPRVARLQRFVGGAVEPAPEPPSPTALAELVTTPSERRAAVERLVLAAMLVPPLNAARLERLDSYAAALERSGDPALLDLRRALAGQHRRLSSTLMRRFPPAERIRATWRDGRYGGRWRFVKAMIRLPDRATATRFGQLGELPEGTLGRGFFEHCRRNGFPLPGERGGVPEPIVFHDMGHALLEVGTHVDAEVWIGAFEAGCMGERGITMLEFALLLFNLGAQLPTDAAPAVEAVNVDILFDAYEVGRRSTFDVLGWDPWADVAEPVESLRRRYSIALPPAELGLQPKAQPAN